MSKKAFTVRFDELFWGLKREEFPRLEKLIQTGRRLSETAALLNEADYAYAYDAMKAVATICEQNGYEPIIMELAIIADQRMLDGKSPFFASYIGGNARIPGCDAIMDHYRESLATMKKEPIVPHRYLYTDKDGTPNGMFLVAPVFQRSWGELKVHGGTSPVDTDGIGHPTPPVPGPAEAWKVQGIQYHFEHNSTPTTDVSKRILQYLYALKKRLRQHARSGGFSTETKRRLERSRFVALPLIRPYEGRETEKIGEFNSLVPGGVLFVFLTPTEPEMAASDREKGRRPNDYDQLSHLGHELHSMLAISGLRESYAALDLLAARRDVFSSMSHGTINTIRGIRAKQIGKLLTGNQMPLKPGDFKFKDLRDDRTAGMIIDALHCAVLGEETACALISFAEIELNDGKIRHKLTADSAIISFRTIVADAAKMVNFKSHQNPRSRPVLVRWEAGDAELPQYYLDFRIIRGIVAEVLLNASIHGEVGPGGKVGVQCRISQSGNGVRCEFINLPKSAADRVEGNLTRLRDAMKLTRNLTLNYSGSTAWGVPFVTTLELGELLVEVDMERTSRRIGPVFREKMGETP